MKKDPTIGDLANVAEFPIDKLLEPTLSNFFGIEAAKLIKEAPIATTALAIGKVINSIYNRHRTKMLLAFIESIKSGEKTMDEFNVLSDKEKDRIRSLVISQLDLQSDELQAEAMGFAVRAYLAGKIDNLSLMGIVSEIKNTNPLLYNPKTDPLRVSHDKIGPALVVDGSVNLLPAAFYYQGIDPNSLGWGGITSTRTVLSKLGEDFYEYVYQPMNKKYTA